MLKQVKKTMKVGATLMVGHGVMGSIGSIGGIGVPSSITSGMNLVGVGQMAENGMAVAKMFKGKKKSKMW